MGVDINTYRGRIGSFSYQLGLDVVTITFVLNFSRVLKCIGSVVFIGLLLIIAGIEQNPGPNGKEEETEYKRVLMNVLPKCVKKLHPDPVLDSLLAEGILTDTQTRDISDLSTTSDRNRSLIIEISKRGVDAFNSFMTALKDSNQFELAEYIEQRLEEMMKKEISASPQGKLASKTTETPQVEMPRRVLATKFDERQDNNSDTDEDEYYDTHDSVAWKKVAEIECILNTLGLTAKIETKITISDVIQLDYSVHERKWLSPRDIPYIFIKRLLSGNSDAMDYRSYQMVKKANAQVKGSAQALYRPRESDSISPHDLFSLVYQCCDPFLKQLLFQKLYLCKISFPFLHKEYPSSKSILALWPLRSLVIETMEENSSCVNKIGESELLKLPINVVSFARFGRPNLSKSKLLNSILCENGSNTFFHKDRPLGTSTRYSTAGNVEMFYLPVVSCNDNAFNQPIMVLNLRGDLRHDFNESVSNFISAVSDIMVIVIDSQSFHTNISLLEKTIIQFKSVVLIFSGPLGPGDGKIFRTLRKLEDLVLAYDSTALQIISTHSEVDEKHYVDIIAETRDTISGSLSVHSIPTESLEKRLMKTSIETDETDTCKDAFMSAFSIIESMEQIAEPAMWTKLVTPIQSTNSIELGILLKKMYRNSDLTLHDGIRTKISEERDPKQIQITYPVKLFSDSLIGHENDHSFLQYFLSWMTLLLERQRRTHIYMENKPSKRSAEFRSDMADYSKKADNTYLETGHLFREIGHICDSLICSNSRNKDIDFPPIQNLARVVANLVSYGYAFELLDGNSFYMPTGWIKMVLELLHNLAGKENVLTLSVLGVQSSGKSTLLNTMFGLQFPTSSGRCTRGIHMQLIPVSRQKCNDFKIPFKYVLIIDTEGVRAPEFIDTSETCFKRDNELSTIITGLGDITMLNVMGESSSEMRDILPILAHAFLRLKLANNRLDIRKSCFFIHQNVSDVRASEKMEQGLLQSVKYLDKATNEAAEFEGISDITTFSQIIELDPESHVWYLPNFWQGYPPMASVNQKYCNKVVELNSHLVRKSMNERDKSFKTLADTFIHINDLWKGVLAENFVFSFRNSIEKKAYIELEIKMKDELWTLECSSCDTIFQMAHNRFSQCNDNASLRSAKGEVITEMKRIIATEKSKTEEKVEKFLNENNYKDITIKWQEASFNRIKVSCQEMIDNRKTEIDRLSNGREVDIMISIMCTKHDEELRRKSLELAKEVGPLGKSLNEEEANKRFEKIWKKFVDESISTDTFISSESDNFMRKCFLDCLTDKYETHAALLNSILSDFSYLDKRLEIKTLHGSFEKIEINENHISLVSQLKKLAEKFRPKSKASGLKAAREDIETIFLNIDLKVKHICQKNREITSRDIKKFLNEVDYLIRNIQTKNANFTLKITCILRIAVYVSCYSYHRFKNENAAHQQSQGISVRLQMYKKQVHERFLSHLMQRKTEDIAAKMMRTAIEEYVRLSVKDVMSVKVKGELKNHLPILKYNLLLEMMTSLVQEKCFHSFMRYILRPKEYAYLWVSKMADHILFSETSKMYETLAKLEISKFLSDINKSFLNSVKDFSEDTPSIEKWLQHFISLLSRFKIPKEYFHNVVIELGRIERLNISEFTDKIIEELQDSEYTIVETFTKISENTVKWGSFNPVEEICTEIWGCPEQCLFCGEPCIKGYVHNIESSHICLQHRPWGCSGLYDRENGRILLETCNLSAMGNAKVQCSIIDFKCNPQNRVPCSEEWHLFKEYKTFAPGWDIEPANNMDDRSKFWMWFIGVYAEELSEYHTVDVTNVPKSWENISEHDALRSLRTFYGLGERTENK
ncbi:interferon-induced very large GTPase 1-like isoform X1 [Mercenaria mercenaria]|uniref:interferon-induced very large GTPase 1-like isoform X1 n=1 Tax=Mercenaria mercenaria TaxID=6596 RepID=UPI00234EB39B|nr:interferon-induced very large GTPase 1-like isoform X1 [Mercenaria mercenaria]XP_053373693.1 interferon-induced very large GTPase 1-like isoform X1 [Mercenaria mercenaria]